MFESAAKHAFISYVSEDAETIRKLRDDLALHGVKLWSDDDIPAGSFWEQVIQEKIQDAGFLVACFSAASQARRDNFMIKELRCASDAMGTPTPERPWLVPVLLSDMPIPDLPVGELRDIDALNWVPLFNHWDRGVREIRDAVLRRVPPVLGTLRPTYVFASDVHTMLAPLTQPGDPLTPRGMLASAKAYGDFYQQGQRIAGTRFYRRPLSKREIDEHHLWKRVRAMSAPELPGAWHRQLPIVCEPVEMELTLDPAPGQGAAAKCFVHLWPGGWSSNLEIDLPGEMQADDVTTLVSRLRSRREAEQTGSPLLCNGERVNAAGLFARLAGQMRQELGLARGEHNCRVPSNFVLGVADAHRQSTTYARLPSDARVTLHQMLRGGSLEPEELPGVEEPGPRGENRYLYTKLRRHNFVVTVFGRGSVVAASDGWGDDVESEERMNAKVMRCLTGNVRSGTAQSLMLAFLVSDARASGWLGAIPALDALVAAARRQLLLLARTGSRFEKTFCGTHQTIVQALAGDAPAPARGAAAA